MTERMPRQEDEGGNDRVEQDSQRKKVDRYVIISKKFVEGTEYLHYVDRVSGTRGAFRSSS